MNPELSSAWGNWISSLEDWKWFVTLTFRDPPAGPSGHNKPGWARAKSAWNSFEKFVEPPLGGLKYIRAMELQPWRGVPHIHALVAGMNTKEYKPVSSFLWNRFGFCRILDYDSELGANYYIAKYVTKELGDIVISPNIHSA